jgi:hypothetical protein
MQFPIALVALVAVGARALNLDDTMDAGEFVVSGGGGGGGGNDGMQGIGMEAVQMETPGTAETDGGLFVHQFLAGEDVANPDDAESEFEQKVFTFAKQMVNYQYVL